MGRGQSGKHTDKGEKDMAEGKKENQDADHMIRPVAYIHTDFPTKFGIPRQSGLTGDLEAKIVFEPEFSNPEAIRGIEEFSHLWLIWEFSENVRKPGNWSATVRPPRLGGNMRVGVFATRSPFRPNPLGLSVVKLKRVEYLENGAPVLVVTGADMMDGTPVFDIKPYVPFADSHPEAKGGFTDQTKEYGLAGGDPGKTSGVPAGRKAGSAPSSSGPGSPPVLPGGSGPGLWHGICRI